MLGRMILISVLFSLLGLAAQAAAQDLFVANFGNNTVNRITTKGNKIVSTISVIGGPFDVECAVAGDTCYVSQRTGGGVAVIDTATNALLAGIGGMSSPGKMAINGADTRLYVPTATNVTAVNISQNPDGTRVNQIVPAESIELAAYGGSAFTGATCGGFLSVGTTTGWGLLYDVSASPPVLLLERNFTVGVQDFPFFPGCTKLYAVLGSPINTVDENGQPTPHGDVHVLRTSSLAVKTVLAPGFTTLENAALVGDKYLYITGIDGNLFSIDVIQDTVVATTPITAQLEGIAVSSGDIFATDPLTNTVQTISLGRDPTRDRTGRPIFLDAGAGPFGIAVLQSAPKGGGKP